MNNKQDDFNNNPQSNILNNSNGMQNNPNAPLNVIPNSKPVTSNTNNEHEFDNDYLNEKSDIVENDMINSIKNINPIIENQINNPANNIDSIDSENQMLNLTHNKFINTKSETQDTSLTNLNVSGEYHDMPKIDYSQDPQVRENINMINNAAKKNTINIGSEGKIFIIIIIVLLLFIFVMPTIFEAFRNIKYQ